MSRPNTSCVRCSQSHSTPNAFIVTCSECRKAWHHRCHIPPISDEELLARVNATNANDVDNGLDGWTCRKCSRTAQSAPKPAASVIPPTAVDQPLAQQSAPAKPQPQAQPLDSGLSNKSVVAPKLKYKQAAARKPLVRSRTSDDGQTSPAISAAQPQDGAHVSSSKRNELPSTGGPSKKSSSSQTSLGERVSIESGAILKASLATTQPQTTTTDSLNDNVKSEAEQRRERAKIKQRKEMRSAKSRNSRIPPVRHDRKATSREDDEQEEEENSVETEARHWQINTPKQTTDISESKVPPSQPIIGGSESSSSNLKPGATLASDIITPQLPRAARQPEENRVSIGHATVPDHGQLTRSLDFPSRSSFALPSSSTSDSAVPTSTSRASARFNKTVTTHSGATVEDVEMGDDDDLYGPYPSEQQLANQMNRRTSNDIEMEDDDDLYGPLPVEARSDRVGHDAAGGGMDDPRGTSGTAEQQLTSHKSVDLAQGTSWIHGKYTNVAGKSWDLLKQKRERDVPPRTYRAKFHARPLGDRDRSLLNFDIEDWLRSKQSQGVGVLAAS